MSTSESRRAAYLQARQEIEREPDVDLTPEEKRIVAGPEWDPLVSNIRVHVGVYPCGSIQALTIVPHPDHPDAWRREPYYGQLKRWSRIGLHRTDGYYFTIQVADGRRFWWITPNVDVEMDEELVAEIAATPVQQAITRALNQDRTLNPGKRCLSRRTRPKKRH